jgi:flagellar biosynthesis chaperone FliJ
MAGFQFHLQALLDQRTEAKQQAEKVLAEHETELAAERQTLKELEDEAHRAAERYQRKRAERLATGVQGGSIFTRHSDFLVGLKLDVQEAQSGVLAQQVFVEQASEAVQQARAALEERRHEAEILEKYRQKAEKRFLQEAAYREELEQDEIGNVMHLNRRAKA